MAASERIVVRPSTLLEVVHFDGTIFCDVDRGVRSCWLLVAHARASGSRRVNAARCGNADLGSVEKDPRCCADCTKIVAVISGGNAGGALSRTCVACSAMSIRSSCDQDPWHALYRMQRWEYRRRWFSRKCFCVDEGADGTRVFDLCCRAQRHCGLGI